MKITEFIGQVHKKHIYIVAVESGELKLEEGLLDFAWVAETEQDKWDFKTLEILEHYQRFMQSKEAADGTG